MKNPLLLLIALLFAKTASSQPYQPYFAEKVLHYCDSVQGQWSGKKYLIFHGICLDLLFDALEYSFNYPDGDTLFFSSLWQKIPLDEALPGDVANFGCHVGIFLKAQGDSVLVWDQNPNPVEKTWITPSIKEIYRPKLKGSF